MPKQLQQEPLCLNLHVSAGGSQMRLMRQTNRKNLPICKESFEYGVKKLFWKRNGPRVTLTTRSYKTLSSLLQAEFPLCVGYWEENSWRKSRGPELQNQAID